MSFKVEAKIHHFNAYKFVNTPELLGFHPLDPHRGSALDSSRGPEAGPWTLRRKEERLW
ncbi:hypothetical protein HOLleu_29326 [Holothuria leucospilota]|uniref:Uncharacterized protein n=1 Tax=Holothuria leucospilota TaxID=206669 RepID=A0A9Q1BNK5_HOLLE|nr:hypothetical protein HOLleu_29326 [Holothuria leucospilota]